MQLRYAEVESPIGRVRFVVRGNALCALGFDEGFDALVVGLARRFGAVELLREGDPARIATMVRAYFAGELRSRGHPGRRRRDDLSDQRAVWAALRKVPPLARLDPSPDRE